MILIKKAFLYALIVWLIPFVVAFIVFPLKASLPALFESIMAVVVALVTVIFAVFYLKKINENFIKEGVWLGIIWFVVCIVIDLLLFMWGPMKMTLLDYLMDIGLTYLVIPTITIGFGYLKSK